VATVVVLRRCGGGAGLEAVAAASWQWRWQHGRRCSGVSTAVAGVVAAVAAWWQRWWRQSGSSVAVAAWRWWQCGGSAAVGSVAVVLASAAAVRGREAWGRCRQHGGDGAGSAPVAAAWWLQQKFGGIAASAVAAEWRELRCHRAPPRWQQRHRR
jgi:hypothetical protein